MLPTRRDIQNQVSFAIKVDFVRGKGDPSRPFRTMVGLLDALASLDQELVKTIDASIESQFVLEDIETGSVKSWILSVLHSADDTALSSGDWKKLVGSYLVKCKYIVIRKLSGAKKITQAGLLETIQSEILREAEQTGVRGLPGYVPISRMSLAAHITQITFAMKYLQPGDMVTYESRDGVPVEMNATLEAGGEELVTLLTSRSIKTASELILKVKKPDFTGHSMWEFHHAGHVIDAKVLDEEWLTKFQREGLGLRPGSSLRAVVEVELLYDEGDEAVFERYAVIKVLDVLPPAPNNIQLRILESEPPTADTDE